MALKYHSTSRGQIAYQYRGLGDPLLLVHGIYPGASHEEFHRNITALASHFTVYAIDLLGFGQSDMPRLTYTVQIYQHLLRDFIVEVIGQPTHVLASGMGCGPVATLAVYDDQILNKIVLIDPQVNPSQPTAPPSLAGKVQQFLLGTLSLGNGMYEAVSSEFELRNFLQSRYAHPRRVKAEHVRALHERALQRHALYGFISYMTGHLAADIPRLLAYVRNEVLILWGQHLGPAPEEKFLRPATWSRGKRIEVIPDSAHWPHDEQSAKVNSIVSRFLSS